MKYVVYLTVNTKCCVNGIYRIYIGVHKTEDPSVFDGYIGNGVYVNAPSTYMYPKTAFQYAVKKYGVDAFMRIIMFIYDNAEEAYAKEATIVDENFLKLPHVYNMILGGQWTAHGLTKPLYQFDLDGKLRKTWTCYAEAAEFFGTTVQKLRWTVHDKHSRFDSYWATVDHINVSEYDHSSHGSPASTYLYTLDGKCLMEFPSQMAVAEYLGTTNITVRTAIRRQRAFQNKYYISDRLVDLFVPKPRAQYLNSEFFVYKETGEFIGSYKGKALMPIINLHSWTKIRDIMVDAKGWYKKFWLSEEKVDVIPERDAWHRTKVDVYDKYGNFIETAESVKNVREKYDVPSSRIKHIQQGDKHYKDWIFRYHSVHSK